MKWEYLVITTSHGAEALTKEINKLAESGWEPVFGIGDALTVLFRRPKK
jgi:hypothetical protein